MSHSEWEGYDTHYHCLQVNSFQKNSSNCFMDCCEFWTLFNAIYIFFITLIRCGPLIDLCRGPHVRHTGKIKAMKIYKVKQSKHFSWSRFLIFKAQGQILLPLHILLTELVYLLGGPFGHGDSAEDLRDLFSGFKDAEGMGAFSGGGQESRPSQDWQSESLERFITKPTGRHWNIINLCPALLTLKILK